MPEAATAKKADADVVKWVITAGVLVAVFILLKSGFLNKVGGLLGGAADTANAALKTVRRVGADIDPFNADGKLRGAMRAIDPSKPLKGASRAIGGSAKAAGKAVKKLKFW